MKFTRLVSAAAFSLLSFASAHAATVSALNPMFSFSWSYNSAAGLLKGDGSMSFSGFGTTDLTSTVTLNNTSALSTNRLTAFGFGIDPNATSVSFVDAVDGGFIAAVMPSTGRNGAPNIAGDMRAIEVCAFSGTECPGGGGGGILGGTTGNSDTFKLVLKSSSLWSPTVTIDPLGFKYQTAVTSYHFGPEDGTVKITSAIPEPETYAMMLAGLGLMGTIARRRKNKNA